MRNEFTAFAIISILGIGLLGYFWWQPIWWAYIVIAPIVLWGLYDMAQDRHAIVRNFPILGRGRYLMEKLRPGVRQYFIEDDKEGTPINRLHRSIVYQRAKEELATNPFGTQYDLYQEGYEWMNHSIAALDPHSLEQHPRVLIGGEDCKQPYSCSIYNVSAMSYGSLSKAAIAALNGGAAIGKFAHNTGEGGISPYHNEFGGDLIYQVGTGYFGCRSAEGGFSDELFKERTAADNVKMIELKLSQGAKPGHGGILPAKKNTPEIAKIRSIQPGQDVLSPPYHKEFNTPVGLLEFIKKMRDLSGGKPIGFKLCVGYKSEFIAICKAMVETGIKPDFIAVDGGEGGTGAAPLEFSDSVGMPHKEGLAFVVDALIGFDLKKDIKIIAAGKITTAFHLFRTLCLGADVGYTARAMMLALGCIQALECNKNNCPTGVATQDPELVAGLKVSDKKVRVANYHHNTVESFVELMAAAGISDVRKLNRTLIWRRVNMTKTVCYNNFFPYLKKGCLLMESDVPAGWKSDWEKASVDSFLPKMEVI